VTPQQRLRGDVAVLVPAAGLGVRLGPGGPKALRLLGGEPLLVHAVRRVLEARSVGCVVVAAPADALVAVGEMLAPVVAQARAARLGAGASRAGRPDPAGFSGGPAGFDPPVHIGTPFDHGAESAAGASSPDRDGHETGAGHPDVEVHVVAGGATRQLSVAAALAAVPDEYAVILVHDAARALTPALLVERVAQAVRDGHAAAIPVLPVVDTIKQVDLSGAVLGTVDRSVLRAVQTPQGFRREVLVAAHAAAVDDLTDDAGLAEKLGYTVMTVLGEETALKVTRPFDLAVAEHLLTLEQEAAHRP
jgi:2-C-methyl-D-erythritol 4-phosphate cytidylyltransferase